MVALTWIPAPIILAPSQSSSRISSGHGPRGKPSGAGVTIRPA